MMLELDDYDYELLKEVEKANLTNYKIIDIQNKHYIDPDNLLRCIEDTQENREYAEKKLIEIAKEYDSRKEDNIPGLEKSLQNEVNKLKEENEKLKANQEAIICKWNEDDYDRAFERGFEL